MLLSVELWQHLYRSEIFELHIQDWVLFPILIVEEPPLLRVNLEILFFHGLAQKGTGERALRACHRRSRQRRDRSFRRRPLGIFTSVPVFKTYKDRSTAHPRLCLEPSAGSATKLFLSSGVASQKIFVTYHGR